MCYVFIHLEWIYPDCSSKWLYQFKIPARSVWVVPPVFGIVRLLNFYYYKSLKVYLINKICNSLFDINLLVIHFYSVNYLLPIFLSLNFKNSSFRLLIHYQVTYMLEENWHIKEFSLFLHGCGGSLHLFRYHLIIFSISSYFLCWEKFVLHKSSNSWFTFSLFQWCP